MDIKSVRKIKPVRQSGISTEDPLKYPTIQSVLIHLPSGGFEFAQRRIFLNGKEIGQCILEAAVHNSRILSQLAADLEKFKKECLKKRKQKERFLLFTKKAGARRYSDEELSVIFARCDACIAKIGELIKQRYDRTKDGMSVVFDEQGQLILNGINVHAFVEQCRQNPNPKSLTFLKGMKGRLERILDNKSANKNYNRIQNVITALFKTMDEILASHQK